MVSELPVQRPPVRAPRSRTTHVFGLQTPSRRWGSASSFLPWTELGQRIVNASQWICPTAYTRITCLDLCVSRVVIFISGIFAAFPELVLVRKKTRDPFLCEVPSLSFSHFL